MEEKYSLEGKLVSVFLRGGWEFTGRVEFSSQDKVVLLSDMGSLVIYKENIVAAMIVDETKSKKPVEQENRPTYDTVARPRVVRHANARDEFESDLGDQEFYANDLYGSVIPEDMLEGTVEHIPVSFSISLADLKNPKPKESKDGPTAKAPEHRGKD